MKAQSLSIVVHNKNCINNCAFCVSHIHAEDYKNQMDDNLPLDIGRYVRSNGRVPGVLPYGAAKYSLQGMSVVVDDDCMGKGVSNSDASKLPDQDTYKYLILRPDCKLNSQWDDIASLIF